MKRLIKHGWMVAALGLSMGFLAVAGGAATVEKAEKKDDGAKKAQAPAAVPDLKLIWKKGQVSRYEIRISQSSQRQIVGDTQTLTFGNSDKIKVLWKVEEADPAGGGKCSMLFEEYSVELTDPEGKKIPITVDKDDYDNDHFKGVAMSLKAIVGQKVIVTVNSSGDAVKVEGFEAIKKRGGDSGGRFSENYFKEMATDLAIVARGDAKPALGASWDRKYDWTHEFGNIHLKSKYTLARTEKIEGVDVAVINRESSITYSPDSAKDPKADKYKSTYKMLKGAEKTRFLFDTTRNENIGLSTVYNLSFEMAYEIDGRGYVQKIENKIQNRVVRLDEK